jgi:hypothetical protein
MHTIYECMYACMYYVYTYVCMYVCTYVYVCIFETNSPWKAGKVIMHKHTITHSQHHTFMRAMQRKWACWQSCCGSLLALPAATLS